MRRFFTYLASFRQDQYCHFIVCMMIAQLTAKICKAFGVSSIFASIVGFATAMLFGFGKELIDKQTPGDCFDWSDIKADAYGALLGSVLEL
jgi:uncharacterized protein YfiM (DUF2279 family)